MKTLHIFKFIVLMVLLSQRSSAQNTVKLTGWIDPQITKAYQTNEIIFRIKDTTTQSGTAIDNSVKATVQANGTFKINFELPDTLAYIAFELQDNSPSNSTGILRNISNPERTLPFNEMYLFERNDSINVEIREKDKYYLFTGKGSEKLNAQFQLYNIPYLAPSILQRSAMIYGQKKLKESIALETRAVEQQIQQALLLLESYKQELKPYVYDLLLIDAISMLQEQVYFKLPNYFLWFPSKTDQLIVQNYFDSIANIKLRDSIIDVNTIARSAMYPSMLLDREFSRTILFNPDRKTYFSFSFEEFYTKLKHNYSGLLRDKLITLLFEKFIQKKSDDAKRLYRDAYATVQLPAYKAILQQLMERYYAPAYPFTFYDASNKPYKLQDFKGKLIVMDFWFSGCVPCTMVAKTMHPIYAKFKDRKDVVFITVSTDQKQEWLQSVKSGLYTSNGMLNLYTNGEGFKNPMITYYQFTGFPRQLIIGKDSKLITASPPRPDTSKENTLAFEKLIEDNL